MNTTSRGRNEDVTVHHASSTSRMRRRIAPALLAVALLCGCGGSTDSGNGVPAAGADDGAPPLTDPGKIERVRLERCPETDAPGGFDVKVRQLGCAEAQTLLLVLGDPFGRYNEAQEALYKPRRGAAADWTCFATFDPAHPDIRHLCWNDESILSFKQG